MRCALAICSLTLLLAATQAVAQVPDAANQSQPQRYSLSDIGETRAQRQRREQRETARSLIFDKAASRAKRREDRIALDKSYGISRSRPTSRPLGWFAPNWWSFPRIIYIQVDRTPESESPSTVYGARRY
jgi:hypothetical protein